ncbi:hypothetical protein LSAT2_020302 [Lamellibrachia satsuma]|nr:hypothetical protein LSAT2_020302 [Lamellibrachia satsuma]
MFVIFTKTSLSDSLAGIINIELQRLVAQALSSQHLVNTCAHSVVGAFQLVMACINMKPYTVATTLTTARAQYLVSQALSCHHLINTSVHSAIGAMQVCMACECMKPYTVGTTLIGARFAAKVSLRLQTSGAIWRSTRELQSSSVMCVVVSTAISALLEPGVSEISLPTRRYKCHKCGKPFSTIGGLRSHEDMHRGQYRYRCQYCMQGFPSTTNLRRHLTKHTGVREFQCAQCSKAFSSLGDLKRHSKSFKCQYYNG